MTGSLYYTLGYANPFRYRGYIYDDETGLHYLKSRYYNPALCRFINADVVLGSVGQLLSHNMFAYCSNNPVNMVDPNGRTAASIAQAAPFAGPFAPFILGIAITVALVDLFKTAVSNTTSSPSTYTS